MLNRRREKRPSRNSRIERVGAFTLMPRSVRLKAQRMFCEVCNIRYGRHRVGETHITVRQAIDHTFPRRFVQSLQMNEHAQENLLSCCGTCHGKKLQAEKPIFAGDAYAYMRNLIRINWNMERVMDAARIYGFAEVCEKFLPLTKSPR